jgi:glycine cleavage system H lipoate-binding protein
VADLVGRLKDSSPDDAADVAETLTQLTAEAAKPEPNKSTLRRLGQGIVTAAKAVADVAVPVAGAVTAVLKVVGIAAL